MSRTVGKKSKRYEGVETEADSPTQIVSPNARVMRSITRSFMKNTTSSSKNADEKNHEKTTDKQGNSDGTANFNIQKKAGRPRKNPPKTKKTSSRNQSEPVTFCKPYPKRRLLPESSDSEDE